MDQITKITTLLLRLVTLFSHKIQQKTYLSNRIDSVSYGLGISSILLRWYKPILPLYQAMHDDALFVRYANNIINGKWLGDYALQGNLTMAKPPGFAIFLAFAHLIPLPFLVVIQFSIVLSAISIMRTLRFIGVKKEVALFGYAATIFSPIWFGKASSRIYRDFFLAALIIALIAVTLLIMRIYEKQFARTTKIQLSFAVVMLGLLVSFIRITKNIEIAAYAFVGLNLVCLVLKDYERALEKRKYIFIGLVLFFISINSLTFTVEQLNKSHYGVALTDNYSKGEFPKALNNIASVKDLKQQPYVPLTRAMRFSIYKVSPTFRELSPILELPNGAGWRGQACNSPLRICNETALWFTWELRDAVVMRGLGDNAVEFENFFRKVSNEIVNGCEKKIISCGQRGFAPGIGPISELSPRHIFESLSGTGAQIFGLAGAGGESAVYNSTVGQDVVDYFNSTVHGIPANQPLNNYAPGINSGMATYGLLENIYRPVWQMFYIFGIVGLLVFVFTGNFRSRANLLGIAFCGVVAALILCMQLAILDSEMGLFVAEGTAYYLPIYPFIFLAFTIGINSIVKTSQKKRIE